MSTDREILDILTSTGLFKEATFGSNILEVELSKKGEDTLSMAYIQEHILSVPREEIPIHLATGRFQRTSGRFYEATRIIFELRLQGVLP